MEGPAVVGQALTSRSRRPKRSPPAAPGPSDLEDLQAKVHELEGRVRALAISRRVLITLLVSADKKRKLEVTRLRAEIEKLRQRTQRTSAAVTTRDAVIHRLRYQMAELTGVAMDESDLARHARPGCAGETSLRVVTTPDGQAEIRG